jgi:imidazoleglycerol phosphate synthase glutamine amidotransferase subunit HisH
MEAKMNNPFKGKVATAVLDLSDEDGKKTGVQYHDTIIVEFTNDTIKLNSGGWRTVTTKRRMNQVSEEYDLAIRVYQKYDSWWVERYIGQAASHIPLHSNYGRVHSGQQWGTKIPFTDNMIIKR